MTSSVYSKVVSFILLAVALFYVTALYYSAKADDHTQSYVSKATIDFYNVVKVQGKITSDTYFSYIGDLLSTGVDYKVTMEHSHKSYDPVYDELGNFTGKTNVNYSMYFEAEIIEEIENNGVYYLTKDDTFSVAVVNTSPTVYGKLKSLGNTGKQGVDIAYFTGGLITDENY